MLAYGIVDVLAYLQENCLDRQVWDVAQKSLDQLHGFTQKMKSNKNNILSQSDSPPSVSIFGKLVKPMNRSPSQSSIVKPSASNSTPSKSAGSHSSSFIDE